MKIEKRDLVIRPRRLRRTDVLRRLVRETHLHTDDLIAPVFITAGENKKNPISSMPGVYQWSIDRVNEEIDELFAAGIDKIILFGIPNKKDSTGSDSYSANGIIQQSLKKLKQEYPDLFVITDVCFCEYTDHGHCGVIQDNDVHNDSTLSLLGQQALSHVEAGADMVAPSSMMDGMVGEIRFALDSAGYDHIPIMSYAVKYASAFYGPFREAVDSTPQYGDRKSYQMDSANIREALKEVELDILEGADIIMVKPALAYLDVISHVKDISSLPVACYNVSGEYSMLKAAAEKGWIDHNSA
ncbi:MAG: porphobilinogen synthase, partial [Candidatus Marinimicrobia bacterium]|nr:porphobilinogen synthase [Candidatus Neomarinimicrobiota bacterium]